MFRGGRVWPLTLRMFVKPPDRGKDIKPIFLMVDIPDPAGVCSTHLITKSWVHVHFCHLWMDGWTSKRDLSSSSRIVPHLYIPHRWERYSGTQMLCLHTRHTVLPLWPVQPVAYAWSVCTQQAPQETWPPSQHHSWPPGEPSSVHISQCVRTIHPRCVEGSSCGRSSMVWKA